MLDTSADGAGRKLASSYQNAATSRSRAAPLLFFGVENSQWHLSCRSDTQIADKAGLNPPPGASTGDPFPGFLKLYTFLDLIIFCSASVRRSRSNSLKVNARDEATLELDEGVEGGADYSGLLAGVSSCTDSFLASFLDQTHHLWCAFGAGK